MALTSNGKDFIAAQLVGATTATVPGGASATAVAKYMGITTDTSQTLATATSITSEETANGLSRVAGTVGYTVGANLYTVTGTWNYSGSTAKVIARVGLFNAISGGILVFFTALQTTATLSTSGDSLTIQQTVNLA